MPGQDGEPVVAVGGERGLGDAVARMIGRLAGDVESHVLPGRGHFLPEEAPDDLVRIIAGGFPAPGTGNLDIVDHRVPAGYAPPTHVHHRADEVFFLLDGELEVHMPAPDAPTPPPETIDAESARFGIGPAPER